MVGATSNGYRPEVATNRSPKRVALVLGGGGAAGIAFHAGALLALRQDLGWDPRTADLIVGTSAGSIVAALLRSGLDTDDLAAWGTEVAPSPGRRHLREHLESAVSTRPALRMPSLGQLPHPGLVTSVLRRRTSIATAVLSRLPLAMLDPAPAIETFGSLHDDWPANDTWITATRTRDASRIVFGRDNAAPLGRAVAASCAIPGMYRPVRIGQHDYVDGGIQSPTNADLLTDADIDVAIVLAPMAQRHQGRRTRPDHRIRQRLTRTLHQECATVAARGVACHTITPDDNVIEAMGLNLLDRRRARRVLTAAFLATTPQLDPGLHQALIGAQTEPSCAHPVA